MFNDLEKFECKNKNDFKKLIKHIFRYCDELVFILHQIILLLFNKIQGPGLNGKNKQLCRRQGVIFSFFFGNKHNTEQKMSLQSP